MKSYPVIPKAKKKKQECKVSGCFIGSIEGSKFCNGHDKLINGKKKNKYNAVRQTYKGRSYDSKLEARYAAQLDVLIAAGEVRRWEPQKTLKCIVNGFEICRYALDFYVEFMDGRIEYWEVKSKGTMTAAWRIKWKLVKTLFPKENFVLKF